MRPQVNMRMRIMIFEAMLMTKKLSNNDLQVLSTVVWAMRISRHSCPTCRVSWNSARSL